MAVTATRKEHRSLGQLFKDLSTETATLLRQEVHLAKTEIGEKASCFGANIGTIAAGAALAFAGGLALLDALIRGTTSVLSQFLSLGVAVWLAPLVVGIVLAGIGYAVLRNGLETLKKESLMPGKTTQSLQENKEWLKSKIA
jgi:Putative Actinobacterial Holin-X, holin superfamily III